MLTRGRDRQIWTNISPLTIIHYWVIMQLEISCILGGIDVPKKETLIRKLTQKPSPRNFTINELDTLMSQCGCLKYSGGRGSSIAYFHEKSKRKLTFDGPHPGKELYRYQIKKVLDFLADIGEI